MQWWENAPGRLVRTAPLYRIYSHEGKRRRYRRLINENYPQDTPSNTFGSIVPSVGWQLLRCKEAYRAPILISCRLFESTVRLYHPISPLFTLRYLRLLFHFFSTFLAIWSESSLFQDILRFTSSRFILCLLSLCKRNSTMFIF